VTYVEKQAGLPLKSLMSILETIVARKKERVASAKMRISLGELKSAIRDREPSRDFKRAIKRDTVGGLRIITEIKRASPSKGLIRADFSHVTIASTYEEKKVDAVSILTEEDFFLGSLNFVEDVKKIVSCPILRKDFIFDEYQIYETGANGADALLLIAAILDQRQAEEYLHLSHELGMSVLFEIHNFSELEKALRINAPIIGINNRDLKTLSIDLNTSIHLKKEIPGDRSVVSESGIRTREDVLKIEAAGIDAMLVGTCLMESADTGAKIDELRGI
jgi:indole-3-glycerol phosphate synthase